MGFRLERTYALRWDEGDLAGLEIDLRSTSVQTLIEVKGLRLSADEDRLAELLIEHVKRWNLVDENGADLEVSAENLRQQEPVLLAAVAREWYLAAAGVSTPLDLGSTPTATSAEVSIPMETS